MISNKFSIIAIIKNKDHFDLCFILFNINIPVIDPILSIKISNNNGLLPSENTWWNSSNDAHITHIRILINIFLFILKVLINKNILIPSNKNIVKWANFLIG